MARPVLRYALPLALLAALAGCAGGGPGYRLDTSITSGSHDSRVRFVVLHYTTASTARSLALLSQGQVSSHYLITDESPVRLYRLVDEDRSAWHAGDSQWHGRTWLNASSIGIEIVNPGWTLGPGGEPVWHAYDDAQIDALIALLRDIVDRHGIDARNIVGHSDIAPRRKLDPGPLFPWKRLAEAGLGRWYDENAAQGLRAQYEAQGLPDVAWFQGQLLRLGYAAPRHGQLDDDTVKAMSAFQLHYRPADFSGTLDAESAAILQTLPE